MELNRILQREILISLKKVYPDSLLVSALPGFSDDRQFMGNLFYLQEHGLIEGGDVREPGRCRSMIDAQITRSGLDFLTDDGGLSAILGGVAVKLTSSEYIGAIDQALLHADLDDHERDVIQKSLLQMDNETAKELVLELIGLSVRGKVDFLAILARRERSLHNFSGE